MTPQDNWRPEMARLVQRQDQLERQQRDSTRKVEALQRDADALKKDVDRRLDSLRRETDRQFRDGERRVSRLERSRDTFENLFWFSMPLVTAVAVIVILVIAVVASREQRREPGEPEQRSPSSVDAPWVSSGGLWPPGFVAAGTHFRQPRRSGGINAARAAWAGGPGNYLFLSTVQSATGRSRPTSCPGATARGGSQPGEPGLQFGHWPGEVHGTIRAQCPSGCGPGAGPSFAPLLRAHPPPAGLSRRQRRTRCLHRTCRKRVKHVWTYWGGVLGQLRPALAAQHRLGKRRRRPDPVQAVGRVEARGVA